MFNYFDSRSLPYHEVGGTADNLEARPADDVVLRPVDAPGTSPCTSTSAIGYTAGLKTHRPSINNLQMRSFLRGTVELVVLS